MIIIKKIKKIWSKTDKFFNRKWSVFVSSLFFLFSLSACFYLLGKNGFSWFMLFFTIFIGISTIIFVVVLPLWTYKNRKE